MFKKTCPICENDFETANNKQKFCSLACANKWKRKPNNIIKGKDYAYMLIQHKHGEFKVLFDLEDIEKVEQFKWHIKYVPESKVYYTYSQERKSHKTRKIISLHRYLMNCPKDLVIDHVNHNTLDNRKKNLKICTMFENAINYKGNKSGCVGVYWEKKLNKWRATIGVNYDTISLGCYTNFEDAVKARKQAEIKYFGYVQ